MAVKVEVGTWTGSGSSPQTITLADGAFGTPIAIIVRMVGRDSGPAAGSFASHAILCMGFGTRRGGATQSGCLSVIDIDDVATTDTARTRDTTLLKVPASTTATDYTVALDSFGNGTFTVSYSSAANASGDLFEYKVYGGSDLTDAIVLNWTFDSTGATEVVTGTGFLPSVMFGLDTNSSTTGFQISGVFSFGWASSSTRFWCNAVGYDDGATMSSNMRHLSSSRSDAFLERLTPGGTTTDARWDLDSFDSDGATLGVVDAPVNTAGVNPLLFIQGGVWEAGNKAKATGTGNDTFTLANSSLTPVAVMLATTKGTAVGVIADDATLCVGWGSTPNATRGSAVNNVGGITGPEAINTTSDRFRALDAIIEELTGGATPAETSEAWYDTASAGSFIIDWAVNGGSAALIGYLAVGSEAAGQTYTRDVSDTSEAITEEIARTTTFERSATDVSIEVTDSVARGLEFTASVADTTIELSDTTTIVLSYERALFDGVDVTEQLTPATSYVRDVSDTTIEITDAAAAGLDIARVVTEAELVLSDATTIALDYGRILSDGVDVTEQFTPATDYVRATADTSIVMADTVASAMGYDRALTDTLAVTEALAVARDIATTGADTLTISDTASTATEYGRILAESALTIVDEVTAQVVTGAIQRDISDTLAIVETLAFAGLVDVNRFALRVPNDWWFDVHAPD